MRRFWTAAEDAKMRKRFPNAPTAVVAAELGRSESSVSQRAIFLGIGKSAEYLATPASGRMRPGSKLGDATRFKAGQKSWNKGIKGSCGLHPNCRATQFEKGVRRGVAVKLYQPIGSERVSKDGYLERKINDDMPLQARWRAVHILEWEAVNGRLPKGHALVFKNGNKADIRNDNLELITRAELMKRNSYHNRYPKEVGLLIQLRGALNRQINRRAKA